MGCCFSKSKPVDTTTCHPNLVAYYSSSFQPGCGQSVPVPTQTRHLSFGPEHTPRHANPRLNGKYTAARRVRAGPEGDRTRARLAKEQEETRQRVARDNFNSRFIDGINPQYPELQRQTRNSRRGQNVDPYGPPVGVAVINGVGRYDHMREYGRR